MQRSYTQRFLSGLTSFLKISNFYLLVLIGTHYIFILKSETQYSYLLKLSTFEFCSVKRDENVE